MSVFQDSHDIRTGSLWISDGTGGPQRYWPSGPSRFSTLWQTPIRNPVKLRDAWYFIGATSLGQAERIQFGLWTTNHTPLRAQQVMPFEGDIFGGGPAGLVATARLR